MPYDFVIADVFTEAPFGGNQLAVLPDARGLSDRAMQALAREFNFSESTFVLPAEKPGHTAKVRIFTPHHELPFAGHPTVGTAAVLAHLGTVDLTGGSATVLFEEGVGTVGVEVRRDSRGLTFSRLTLEAEPEMPAAVPDRGALAAALSLPEEALLEAWYGSVGVPFCFARLADAEAVDGTRPDRAAWAARLVGDWNAAVFLFAGQPVDGARLYARMYAPGLGIEEDPATGAASATLAGTLAARSPMRDGTFRTDIDQGVAMGRPSVLSASAEKRAGKVVSVSVGGATVVVGQGTISAAV
jgi:trans-2,3-dihydro-3-hydroxyanthranilate isomerase